MSDPRETLDRYAAEDFEPFPHTLELAEVAPKAFAALYAVLHLHRAVDRGAGWQCAGCATHVTFTPWPCATVKAITAALEGGVGVSSTTNPEPPAREVSAWDLLGIAADPPRPVDPHQENPE